MLIPPFQAPIIAPPEGGILRWLGRWLPLANVAMDVAVKVRLFCTGKGEEEPVAPEEYPEDAWVIVDTFDVDEGSVGVLAGLGVVLGDKILITRRATPEVMEMLAREAEDGSERSCDDERPGRVDDNNDAGGCKPQGWAVGTYPLHPAS